MFSAQSKPKAGPAKINLAQAVKEVKPKIAPAPLPPRLTAVSVKPPQPAKPISKPPVTAPLPAKEKRPLIPVKPKKDFKDSFWGKLLKFIKDKISALNQAKTKPAEVNLAPTAKTAKPQAMAEPPRPPLGAVVKTESLAKAKSSQHTEPIKIDKTAPRVLATNLIRGEIVTFFDWQKKVAALAKAILIPMVLIGLVYLGLIYYQKQSQARMEEQIKKYDDLTAEVKQEEVGLSEIIGFQARLKVVSQIFSKHIYWTNFFKFLEDNTIKNVYYTGFDGDTGGNYSLDAMTKRFSDISRQFDVLKSNGKITEVKTIGGEAVSGNDSKQTGVKFNLGFSVLKNIFTE